MHGLRTELTLDEGIAVPVDDVDLRVGAGEVVGLVGESGSGKTMTALSVLRLLPPGARTVAGEVLFDGRDLIQVDEKEMDRTRGSQVSVVFQDPMTFLNPTMRIGTQIAESLMLHRGFDKKDALQEAAELLTSVGIGDAEPITRGYPHQLSGGMRQRVLIAIALACHPKMLIADEPFTAVDVSVQDQLIRLLKRKQEELNFSVLLITHDLSVTAELCDRMYVMYAGRIVETGSVYEIYDDPKHPYTQALIKAARISEDREIPFIPGAVPSLLNPPTGCRFHPRCPHAFEPCDKHDPTAIAVGDDRWVRCLLYE